MARFKGPDELWTSRSTKVTDRAKALRLAFELEGSGSTMRTENPTAAQVDRIVRSIWERHTGKRISLNRTDEFFRNWLAAKKLKSKSVTRYEQVITEFIEFLGPVGAFDLRAVEPSHVQEFVAANEKRGRAGTTIEINLKIIASIFNTATRAGLIASNPAANVELPQAIGEEREPFTWGEVQTLISHAKGDWKTAILLSAFAGLRLGDAVRMEWEQVDLAKGTIKFVPQKTSRRGKTLEIPLHKILRKHLEELAGTDAAQRSKYITPTLVTRPISGRIGLSREFAELMESAHVACDQIVPRDGRSRQFRRKTFHSLRHFHVSALANSGVDEGTRATLVGHADPKQTRRYSHLNMTTLRTAVNKVGRGKK